MESTKEQLKNFEKEFIWYGINYEKIEIAFKDKVYVFNEKGFSVMILEGIYMYLNEMNEQELGNCWYLIPVFLGKIENKAKKNQLK